MDECWLSGITIRAIASQTTRTLYIKCVIDQKVKKKNKKKRKQKRKQNKKKSKTV